MASETAKLWKDDAFQADPWQDWPEDGALEETADALVPLARFAADPDAAEAALAVGLAPRDERIPADLHAAWLSVARLLLNLSEVLTRG